MFIIQIKNDEKCVLISVLKIKIIYIIKLPDKEKTGLLNSFIK